MIYDEFGFFHENAAEYGIDWSGPPTVRREYVKLKSGLRVSALVWGDTEPEVVLIHGGAQNAHTWDTVALALNRPLVALDMPGHGRSDHRPSHAYPPQSLADDLAVAIGQLAPNAEAVVGMSLGGLAAICLAAEHPGLVRRLGIADVTPGTDRRKAEPVISFIDGPQYFESFEEILERTIKHNPGRSEVSLRRGVLHNAHELPDGRWTWNYDRIRGLQRDDSDEQDPEVQDQTDQSDGTTGVAYGGLWEKVSRITAPTALWRAGAWSVVDDDDVAEWRRRLPQSSYEVVEGAGHSIQGDKPLELASLIEQLLARPI